MTKLMAEKSLELWEPIGEFYYSLRLLTREIEKLQEQKIVVINHMHGLQHAMHQNKVVNKTLLNRLKLIEKQLEDLGKAIQEHIDSNKEIAEKVEICKIKGVGVRTVATLIAETNGFKLFKNVRQLVSFAGYDIVENQSGNHHGRTRISKKRNSHIRRILHLPAFGVVRWKVGPFQDLYEQIYTKHGIKMKSYVAVQEKLLVITYSLWKNDQEYVGKYKNKYNKQEEKELSI